MINEKVKVTFHGAAETVTGSRYLIQYQDEQILVDCGLFQGKKELRLRNWEPPTFNPSKINAIVLTHAHIDHSGYLPLVVKMGYKGPIYCSAATAEIVSILLLDSAHLQEEEAFYANKHKTSKHKPALPLYTIEDAKDTLRQLKVIKANAPEKISKTAVLTVKNAGHVLGAKSLGIEIGGKKLTFSGDVGRYNAPILPDPEANEIGNLLICESTYGNRDHPDVDVRDELADVINQAIRRKGPIIIPAFALGRTQDLLYFLAGLEREGKIPALPVFIDSPMAIDATDIYRKYQDEYDAEAKGLLAQGEFPLKTEKTTFCQTVQQSKDLNFLKGPRIIIAASGMVNGGRVMHHLMQWLPEEQTTVLFVGYQAEETRGRTILRGEREVKIFGQRVPIRARVQEISGLSAHGDRRELLRWLKSSTGTPDMVRITHGEPDSSAAFSELINKEFSWKAQPAKYLETVEI
ncbi:MAG: MBL fold metallo-hydrolase [Proteobacteria bacterium]|nr:MBL fold metallo-hydrolase [Pseudomonadota bacterium]